MTKFSFRYYSKTSLAVRLSISALLVILLTGQRTEPLAEEREGDGTALRETYPELTLSQLAEEFDPPITKSCLNHRLRKLIALSRA